jgi:hypothetical protein
VQDSGGVLAMTAEEKKRLEELMAEIDETDDKIDVCLQAENNNLTYLVNYNPSLVVVDQGDGFTPNREDLERLKHIDSIIENRIVSRANLNSINRFYENDPSLDIKTTNSISNMDAANSVRVIGQ